MYCPAGGSVSPSRLSPQQTSVPSVRRPQVCRDPALAAVNCPAGAVIWPCRFDPQQTAAPSARTPQLWNSPTLTVENVPPGAGGCSIRFPPQQITLSSDSTAHVWSIPALICSASTPNSLRHCPSLTFSGSSSARTLPPQGEKSNHNEGRDKQIQPAVSEHPASRLRQALASTKDTGCYILPSRPSTSVVVISWAVVCAPNATLHLGAIRTVPEGSPQSAARTGARTLRDSTPTRGDLFRHLITDCWALNISSSACSAAVTIWLSWSGVKDWPSAVPWTSTRPALSRPTMLQSTSAVESSA